MTTSLSNQDYAKIFSYIGSIERQKLRAVSKNWKELIELHFGISTVITTENWPWTRNSLRLNSAAFHSFTFPFPSSIRFATELKKVIFSRIVVSRNLISILQKCLNLEALMFNQIILDRSTPIDVPYKIGLPKLKIISINDPSGSGNDSVLLLQFLNSITYGQLEEVNFWCPNTLLQDLPMNIMFDKSFIMTHWLFELVLSNRQTIATTSVGYWRQPIKLHLYTALNSLILYKPIQFRTIDCQEEIPATWDLLLPSQHFLHNLVIKKNAFKSWFSGITKAIAQSHDVVQDVVCCGGGSKYEIVDLQVFKDCHRLEVLKLKYNFCRLIGIALLPVSIKLLILNGPISKLDFVSISNRLQNLEVLFVDNGEPMVVRTAQEEADVFLKVNLEIFKKLMNLSKLKTLSLQNCSMSWSKIQQWCRIDSREQYELNAKVHSKDGVPFKLVLQIVRRKLPA